MKYNNNIGCGTALIIVILAILFAFGFNMVLTHLIIWIVQQFNGPELADKFWAIFWSIFLVQCLFGGGIKANAKK